MNFDLKSVAIGAAIALAVCGAWYAGSTRPVIQKLVEEKAQAVGRANQLEQEKAQYKTAAEHWLEIANTQPQPAAQDPTAAALNTVRPGLGTVAAAVGKIIQNRKDTQIAELQAPTAAANSCRTGMQWNGFKCVCSPPTVPVTMNDGSVACFPAEVAK